MKTIRISTELHQELKSKAAKDGSSLPAYTELILNIGLMELIQVVKLK